MYWLDQRSCFGQAKVFATGENGVTRVSEAKHSFVILIGRVRLLIDNILLQTMGNASKCFLSYKELIFVTQQTPKKTY